MDRVVETPHGYDCVVNGKRFGTWRSRAEAVGGMAVERARPAGRGTRSPQCVSDSDQDFCRGDAVINMTIERLLEDGSKLEDYRTTHHGWGSVKAGTDGLCARYGKRVTRLPNGCEDKKPNPTTGVRERVTFSEIVEPSNGSDLAAT